MDGSRFDEVTRLLARGASRRRILRGLAAGLAGVAGVRTAAAANDCSEFCRQLPPGPQRGQCRSDCAQGIGLFFACEGAIERLCLLADGTAVCCETGESCDATGCSAPPPPGCTSDAECDDQNACTENICDTLSGECSYPPIADCIPCAGNEECSGENACTEGACVSGRCEFTVVPDCVPCTSDEQCDDENECTEDVCVEGRCQNNAVENCGGGCTCSGQNAGGSCTNDSDCCNGFCSDGVCTDGYGEVSCAPVGNFCVVEGEGAGSICCTGICQDCACTCLDDWDQTCTDNRQCCGGACSPSGCCREVGVRCITNDQCCSGHCTDEGYEDDDGVPVSSCYGGPAGTWCQSDGDCINGCSEDGVCECSTDNWCYDDHDCCDGSTCHLQATGNSYNGICETP